MLAACKKEKGERVPDLAKEYGIVPKTIYNLLRKTAQGLGALLELAKLKREKDAQMLNEMTETTPLPLKKSFALKIFGLNPTPEQARCGAGRFGGNTMGGC